MSALEQIESLLREQRGAPPIDRWHPALSGDIDIRILADGRWIHEGGEIRRHGLVKLFASILRREEDGDYYLVTPVEKWRVQVDDLPLLVVDFEVSDDKPARIIVKTNVDTWLELGGAHPLEVEQSLDGQPLPAVKMDHGLAARVNRACFYRMVEQAIERDGKYYLNAGGADFLLGED